jgi:hypothetical protein
MSAKKRTLPPVVEQYLVEQTDPFTIAKTLDADATLSDRAAEVQAHFTRDLPSHVQQLREALRHVDDWCLVEASAQQAGFVLGFGFCRRLLTGKATVAQKGARS